jgi:hypothetical protein
MVGNGWKWLEMKFGFQPLPTKLDEETRAITGKLDGWTGWTAFLVTK